MEYLDWKRKCNVAILVVEKVCIQGADKLQDVNKVT